MSLLRKNIISNLLIMNNIFFIGFGEINSEIKLLNLKNEINSLNPKIVVWDWVSESDMSPNKINKEIE